jgi:hypothetical protein
VAHCLKIGYAHCNASTPETFASGQACKYGVSIMRSWTCASFAC